VAICIMCGMALCMEHLVRDEVPMFAGLSERMAGAGRRGQDTFPRFLCLECHRAVSKMVR